MISKARIESPDYNGSMPLKFEVYETIAQEVVKGTCQEDINKLIKKSSSYAKTVMVEKKEIKKRIAYLTRQAAECTILTKEYIINGIIKESKEAQRAGDRLKAYELLGKTMALFTDKVHLTGMPKRIIIRSESGTEQLGSTTNDTNTSPNG